MRAHPLLFRPVYRDCLWGGDRIARRYARADAPARCGESWEISAHPDGPSVVANGPFAGRDLPSLCAEFGPALLGTACEGRRFPLLFKIIDAHQPLSIQVHPSEQSAAALGGEPKTEMWHVLDAEEGARLVCGLRDCPGPRTLRDAIAAHRVPELLLECAVRPGDSLFVPGGTLHALGAGILVYEVQQSSNTTYRVYDWDRVDADGRSRELHVDKAVAAIDWRAPAQSVRRPAAEPDSAAGNRRWRLLRTDYFDLRATEVRHEEPVRMDGGSFHALFVRDGAARIAWDGGELALPHGTSCLVPASLGAYALRPVGDAPATLLTTTL